MIAYMPEIYPDELVYSWLSRYAAGSGHLTNQHVLQELYSTRNYSPSKEFIGNLNEEAKAAITAQYGMETLGMEHTMFPQYARFIPLAERQEAMYKLCNTFCDAHHLFSILPRSEDDQFMKYCPVCAEEDRKRYGETYWHRTHQLRTMRVCPEHGCYLLDSHVPAISQGCQTLISAETVVGHGEEATRADHRLMKYALYLSQVFHAPVQMVTDIPLCAVLYHGMSKTQYMKQTGRSRYTKKLADDMRNFYQKLGVKEVASIHQIQRTITRQRFYFTVF